MLRTNVKTKKWIWILITVVAGFFFLIAINLLLVSELDAGQAFLMVFDKYSQLFKIGKSPYDLKPDSSFFETLYGFVIYIPFLLISNRITAAALWLATNQTAFIFIVLLTEKLISWKTNNIKRFSIIAYCAAFLITVLILFQGESSLVQLLILMGICWSVIMNHQELAGILIALLTIAPIANFHILILFLFWAANNRRGKTFIWFFIAFGFLVALGLLVKPDWPLEWIRQALVTSSHAKGYTLTSVLSSLWGDIGTRFGTAITILSISALLIEWWLNRRANGKALIWLISLTIIVGAWIGIPTQGATMVNAIISMILIFATVEQRWKKLGHIISASLGSILLIIPWLFFLLHNKTSFAISAIPPVLIVVIPIFIIPILYWIRWWCLNPPEMWFDQLYKKKPKRDS